MARYTVLFAIVAMSIALSALTLWEMPGFAGNPGSFMKGLTFLTCVLAILGCAVVAAGAVKRSTRMAPACLAIFLLTPAFSDGTTISQRGLSLSMGWAIESYEKTLQETVEQLG